MNILITNDDGYQSKGIKVLAEIMKQFGEVTVIAPKKHQSGMSMAVSLGFKQIAHKDLGEGWHNVDATPASCVKFGLNTMFLDRFPDVVVSGINHGSNASTASCYSGTLGAAFEATKNGIPAMAFSSAKNDWLPTAEAHLVPIIRELLEAGQEPGEVWNVNFPARVPEDVVEILRDRSIAPYSMYQEYYIPEEQPDGSVDLGIGIKLVSNDLLPEGSDAHAVRSGCISIGKVKDRVT